jgi:hypothetical protein
VPGARNRKNASSNRNAVDRGIGGFFFSGCPNRSGNGEWQTVTIVADYWPMAERSRHAGQIATQRVKSASTFFVRIIDRPTALEAIGAHFAAGTVLAQALLRNLGVVTMSNAASMSINPLFLRHDLMIELGRLEMAIDDVRTTQPAANDQLVREIESKCARINEALSKLPA